MAGISDRAAPGQQFGFSQVGRGDQDDHSRAGGDERDYRRARPAGYRCDPRHAENLRRDESRTSREECGKIADGKIAEGQETCRMNLPRAVRVENRRASPRWPLELGLATY